MFPGDGPSFCRERSGLTSQIITRRSGSGNGNGRSTVRAEVPATSLSRYAIELRSVAHGTGVFTRTYSRHEGVPSNVTERLLAEAQATAHEG